MAHTRITNKDARIIAQCSSGKHIRNINNIEFSVGAARTNNTAPNLIMADAIQNEISTKGVLVAPCAAKILSISANGSPFVDMDVAGTTYVQVYKAVSGGADTALLTDNSNSGIKVGDATVPTADTAIDGTLSTVSGVDELTVGQHVYAILTVSNHAVQTAVAYVTVTVEWMSTDAAYASS